MHAGTCVVQAQLKEMEMVLEQTAPKLLIPLHLYHKINYKQMVGRLLGV